MTLVFYNHRVHKPATYVPVPRKIARRITMLPKLANKKGK